MRSTDGDEALTSRAEGLLVDDRTAIVTGGTRGVGRSITRVLASTGMSVLVCDIAPETDEQVAALAADGLDVSAVRCDISRADDVTRAVQVATDRFGSVDVLVNNAAISRRSGPLDPWPKALADFDDIVGVNLRGAYLFARALLPSMVQRRRGHVINVTTDHVHTCGWPVLVPHDDAQDCPWAHEVRPPGVPGMDVYDASKWALQGLTFAWAKALRESRVRVNSIALGATDGGTLRESLGYRDIEPPAEVLASWQDPDDVAAVILDLMAEGPDGRSGDSIGLWRGHPTVLPPPSPILDVRS